MRRYVFLILFGVVLVAPFLLRWVIGAGSGTPSGASGDGQRLVVVTPHNQDIRREFARAFDAWHRANYGHGVVIDYRTPGGTNDIKRLLETTYRVYLQPDGTFAAGMSPDIHVVWGGGDYFLDQELKQLFDVGGRRVSVLQPVNLDPKVLIEAFPQPTLAGVKLYDYTTDKQGNVLPPQWVGVCLSSFGIVYNPDLYQALALPQPQAWADLTNQKLAGLVALADPTHSGSAAVAYLMVIQRAMADAEARIFQEKPALKAMPSVELAKNAEYQSALAAGWKRGMGELLLIAAKRALLHRLSLAGAQRRGQWRSGRRHGDRFLRRRLRGGGGITAMPVRLPPRRHGHHA